MTALVATGVAAYLLVLLGILAHSVRLDERTDWAAFGFTAAGLTGLAVTLIH